MKYTGFQMSKIIDQCKTPEEVQRVGNTVWEYPEDLLPRHEMAWFSYRLNKKVMEIRLRRDYE